MITFDKQKLTTAVELKLEKKDLRTAGKEIGVSAPTLSRLMNGKGVDVDTLVKIINWLNMPITRFFN